MRTRFAPSPTGPLHLGHAFSAVTAWKMAREVGGEFLLRIDDIDRERSKETWERQAMDDLAWLGLDWPEPVLRQSRSGDKFASALKSLENIGIVYPCSCSRADIENAASAPQEGVPAHGPDGRIYPGTCRGRGMEARQPGDAIRLDIAKAIRHAGFLPEFTETGEIKKGEYKLDSADLNSSVGDVVLARRTGDVAYHLAVVVDDHGQEISHVVRGLDLFDATRIHVLLQHLLGFPHPIYHHHRLIRDEAGKRLAKRDDARAIARYREDGLTPADVLKLVNLAI